MGSCLWFLFLKSVTSWRSGLSSIPLVLSSRFVPVDNIGHMSRNNSDLSEEYTVETCIFCFIASERDKEAEIMKKDKELVCFKDINPAAPHHYLVVPRQHIHSCSSLNSGHISLVKRMAEMGKAVLRDQGITTVKEIRLGFHQPPYISVNHLHLHVLAPINQISEYLKYKFLPKTLMFVTEESLTTHLKNKAPTVKY